MAAADDSGCQWWPVMAECRCVDRVLKVGCPALEAKDLLVRTGSRGLVAEDWMPRTGCRGLDAESGCRVTDAEDSDSREWLPLAEPIDGY